MASKVFVVVYKNKKGVEALASVHSSRAEADGAATALGDAVVVKEMSIGVKAAGKATTSKSKAKKTKEIIEDDEDEEMMVDEEEEEAAPKPAKKTKAAPKKNNNNDKKEIPDGKPNALKGLTLLFTGTFDSMDRPTCEAAAVHYGATISKKLGETDYVVLGVRAGQKKLEEIEEKQLDTITEAEFFQLLKTGISEDKRRQMSARAADSDEPAKKKARK